MCLEEAPTSAVGGRRASISFGGDSADSIDLSKREYSEHVNNYYIFFLCNFIFDSISENQWAFAGAAKTELASIEGR